MAIVARNYERSKQLLTDHIDLLHKISGELLEKEVLSGAEIDTLIGDALPKAHRSEPQTSV